jgi:hypothetical protein
MRRIKFKTVLELKYKALETEPCSSNPDSIQMVCFRDVKPQCKIIIECENLLVEYGICRLEYIGCLGGKTHLFELIGKAD